MTEETPVVLRPVQKSQRRDAGQIADSVHLAAYEVYSHVFGTQQAMVEGHCRGGFGVGELIAFLYARPFPKSEWNKRVHEAFSGNRNL